MWFSFSKTVTAGRKEIENILLNKSKLQDVYDISSEPKIQPAVAFFINQGTPSDQLRDVAAKFEFIDKKRPIDLQASKKGVLMNGQAYGNFLDFAEKIHSYYSLFNPKQETKINETNLNEAQKVKNGIIEVKKINSADDARMYGSDQSWCIAQFGNTYWQSYRDTKGSTFYFVFDGTRPEGDPLQKVAVDVNENGVELTDKYNTTGTIAKFGENHNAYFEYLESKGVNVNQFKNDPLTDKEKKEQMYLGTQKDDLSWFQGLPYDYKSKYIGRGHTLTNEQFDYLIDNNAQELVGQYLNTGIPINKYQESKLNRQFHRTYNRKIDQFVEEIKKHPEWFNDNGLSYAKGNINFIKKLHDSGLKIYNRTAIEEVDPQDAIKLYDLGIVSDLELIIRRKGPHFTERDKQRIEPLVSVYNNIIMRQKDQDKLVEIYQKNKNHMSDKDINAFLRAYKRGDDLWTKVLYENFMSFISQGSTDVWDTQFSEKQSQIIQDYLINNPSTAIALNGSALAQNVFNNLTIDLNTIIKLSPIIKFFPGIIKHSMAITGDALLWAMKAHPKIDFLNMSPHYRLASKIPFDKEFIDHYAQNTVGFEQWKKFRILFNMLDNRGVEYILENYTKTATKLLHDISQWDSKLFNFVINQYQLNPSENLEKSINNHINSKEDAMRFIKLVPKNVDRRIFKYIESSEEVKKWIIASTHKYNQKPTKVNEIIEKYVNEADKQDLIVAGYVSPDFILTWASFELFKHLVDSGAINQENFNPVFVEYKTGAINHNTVKSEDYEKNLWYAYEKQLISIERLCTLAPSIDVSKKAIQMGVEPDYAVPYNLLIEADKSDLYDILRLSGDIKWFLGNEQLDANDYKYVLDNFNITDEIAQIIINNVNEILQYSYNPSIKVNNEKFFYIIRELTKNHKITIPSKTAEQLRNLSKEQQEEIRTNLLNQQHAFHRDDMADFWSGLYPNDLSFLIYQMSENQILEYIKSNPVNKELFIEYVLNFWMTAKNTTLDRIKFVAQLGVKLSDIYKLLTFRRLIPINNMEILMFFKNRGYKITPLLESGTINKETLSVLKNQYGLDNEEINEFLRARSVDINGRELPEEAIAFARASIDYYNNETIKNTLEKYAPYMDPTRVQELENTLKQREKQSFNYKKFLKQAQFISDKGDDWYVKRIMNIVYGPNWQSLTDVYDKFSEVVDNLDTYKERYRGQLMQNLPQFQNQQPQETPIEDQTNEEEDFFDDTRQVPPIHENCRCYIETMPGGRKIWQFSENCCEECEFLAREFNRKQFELFGI